MEEQQSQSEAEPTQENQQPNPNESGTAAENLLQKPAEGTEGADPWDTDGWKDLLRPDFKNADGEIDVKALAKAYKGAEKRIGSGDIPPKDETGYKIEAQLPEGITLDPEKNASFLKGAHAKGMTNAQVNWVMEQYGNLITEAQATVQANKVNVESALKQEWGDRFDANISQAQKAFHAVASAEDIQNIGEYANNIHVMRMLAKLGANLKEDIGLPVDVAGMADEDVQALQKSDAYWNPKHPDHAKTVRQVTQWHQAKSVKRTA